MARRRPRGARLEFLIHLQGEKLVPRRLQLVHGSEILRLGSDNSIVRHGERIDPCCQAVFLTLQFKKTASSWVALLFGFLVVRARSLQQKPQVKQQQPGLNKSPALVLLQRCPFWKKVKNNRFFILSNGFCAFVLSFEKTTQPRAHKGRAGSSNFARNNGWRARYHFRCD